MKTRKNSCYAILLCGMLFGYISRGQGVTTTPKNDSLHLVYVTDSLTRLRDSLELNLLRSSVTYAQIELVVRAFPPNSVLVDLLPSVLPVNLPIEAFHITSPFGTRIHPIQKQARFHAGVDVKAPAGMTVKATASGVVKQVGVDVALGLFIRVQHAFGFETTYGHLQQLCVKPGQLVVRNEEIGRVGQTGLATGPHLHYVIKKNGSAVDPFQFCFLLRRRLWLYQKTPAASGTSPVDSTGSLTIKGE